MRRRSLIACMIAAGAVMLGACSDSKDIDASKLDRLKSKMEQENAATSGDEKAEEKPEVARKIMRLKRRCQRDYLPMHSQTAKWKITAAFS